MQIHVYKGGRHFAYAFGRKMTAIRLREAAERMLSEGRITAFHIMEGKHEYEGSFGGTCGGAADNSKSKARSGG